MLEKALVAESVITGRLTYLNKDLVRLIPEKNIETYKNLPSTAKLKLGGGHTYDGWLQLWAEGTLIREFDRSRKELDYGDEGPLQYPEDSAGDIPEPEKEAQEPPTQEEDQSSEEWDLPVEPQLTLPPDPPEQEHLVEETSNKRQVHFADDPPTRRSSRTIRAPEKLNL